MENKQIKENKPEQKFSFNDRTKVLSVVTTNEDKHCTKNYADDFNEKQIKELHKAMTTDKSRLEKNIQTFEKSVEESKEKIEKSEIKLTDSQKQLKEDLLVLQQYKPIDDAEVIKTRTEEQLINLNEQLVDKKKIINEIETKCKGVLK